MAGRVPSAIHRGECVQLDETTMGQLPAKQKRELALKVLAYDVKQVLMVRYARDRKVALWVNA